MQHSDWHKVGNSSKDSKVNFGLISMILIFFIALALISFITSLCLALGSVFSAKAMQTSLLTNVLRWPMELFDTTPVGRLLNRFSKDVDTVDNVLPHVIKAWIMMIFMVTN